MKKHAATVVLVVLAVALGVWLWLDRDRVSEGERKRRENNVFVAWRRDELTQVTIVDSAGETLVLVRDAAPADKRGEGKEGLWRMTSPREERADPVAVERLLTALEFATVARKATDTSSLGLDKPRLTGSVRMGRLETKFALGASSPRPEGSSYFAVDAEPPIVVSRELVTTLLAPPDTYRNRTVVPYLATELSKVEVKRDQGGFVLDRIDDHSFRVAETGLLASRAGVDRLWASLAEMRAEAFPKEVDVDRLTAHPTATITLTPKDSSKPPAELVIGEACPGHPADVVVLRRAPSRVAACAPKDVATGMLATAASLADKHVFTLRMDEIEELRLEQFKPSVADPHARPASSLELARKGSGFHARAPVDRDLSQREADAASELVTRIAASEATTVTKGGGSFVATGRALVRAGEREEVVEIGARRRDGGATLRRVIDDARLDVDASVVRRLSPRETSMRARSILEGEPPHRRVTRIGLRCGSDQELVDRGEGFRLVSPAGYDADGSISQLVDAVTRGKIELWVADTDAGDEGFGLAREGGCRVIVGFEDGNSPVTITFGAEGEGGVYARAEPRAGVFVAPRSLRDLAGQIYVSRALSKLDVSRIESVRVTLDGKLARSSSDGGDDDGLRSAAASLSADRIVAVGKKPDGAPDLVIDVFATEGGPPKRIGCRPPAAPAAPRLCSVDGVMVTYAVAQERFAPFLARDGGTK